MLRRILVGIDSTQSSVAALHFGIVWARQHGATLVGLAIVDEPGIRAIEPVWPVGGTPGSDPVYYMGYEPRLAAVHERAQEALAQFATLCDEEGVAHTEIKRTGSPHEQFCEEAQSCDLILIGRGSQFRFIAGDDEGDETVKQVLKNACRAVVVVPLPSAGEGPIVIAYDASHQAHHALTAFRATGLGKSHPVHILSIGADAAQAAEHAEKARAFLSEHGIVAVPQPLVTSQRIGEAILEHTSRLNASLLVMGAYGKPALREFFLGSVTRKLLEEASVPLFLSH
jgi:nucleotide-binding universal stress UspA family protein